MQKMMKKMNFVKKVKKMKNMNSEFQYLKSKSSLFSRLRVFARKYNHSFFIKIEKMMKKVKKMNFGYFSPLKTPHKMAIFDAIFFSLLLTFLPKITYTTPKLHCKSATCPSKMQFFIFNEFSE
jgi:hypothetical protein